MTAVASPGLVSPGGGQLMGVTLFFFKKSDCLVLVIASESYDLFSCRLLTTTIFPHRLSSVLSKFSHKKLISGWVTTPGGCLPAPLPLLTPLNDCNFVVSSQNMASVSVMSDGTSVDLPVWIDV